MKNMHTPEQILENRKNSINRLSEKLKERGFEVISVSGEGLVRQHIWTLRCENGHEFQNTGARLWTKEKCPHCRCSSMEEEVTRLLIEQHYGKEFPNVRPEWLKSPEGQILELDMFNEEMKLAFEYNGVTHYKSLYGDERLQKTQERDAYKVEECKKLGIKLIHIKGIDKSSSKKNMVDRICAALVEYGIVIAQKHKDVVTSTNIVKITQHDCKSKIDETLAQYGFSFVSGESINKNSRFTMVHTCGNNYRFSLAEFRKTVKKGWTCACQREAKGEEKFIPQNFIKRQEIAKKRAEFIGRTICKNNKWTFSCVFQTKHRHTVFQYFDKGELKTCSYKTYCKFVRENNLKFDDFQQAQEATA